MTRLGWLLLAGMIGACGLVLVCCEIAGLAHARPPAGVDPASPMAVWFNSKTNTVGRSCCGLGDGEILEDNDVRVVGDHYEVRLVGKWRVVPHPGADTSPAGGPNPTGKSVVWWAPCPACETSDVIIYCFAPGTMY